MKVVVVAEVQRFLFRQGLQERARYYGVIFLNQMVLSHHESQGQASCLLPVTCLPSVYCPLFTAFCLLSVCLLSTVCCSLLDAYYLFAFCLLFTAIRLFAFCLLLVALCLSVTYCCLFAIHCLLSTLSASHLLPSVCCSLPSVYWLEVELAAFCPLPVAFYLLPSACYHLPCGSPTARRDLVQRMSCIPCQVC